MDYIRTYKSFINSHYLSEGVRITTGVLLPAFIMAYFNMLPTGIVLSMGALFVSVTDSAGPIHHRKNGMTVCIAAILLVTLITGFFASSPILMAIFLFVCCFFFSMISIFGARAGSIGTAAMIVLTITMDPRQHLLTPVDIMRHSLIMASGGLWYLCFSMLLYNFRPFRLAQQALGDCIQTTAQYLQTRAEFFKRDVNYEQVYKQLLQQQVEVQNKQTELSELLFKTRNIVKESTNIGRTLVMLHLDVTDMFETIMMSHQQYPQLHEFFDQTDILDDYYLIAKKLGDELDAVGVAVKGGVTSTPGKNLAEQIANTSEKLDVLRLTYLKPDNIEGFISLRRILENLRNLLDRLSTLHKYTSYETTLLKPIEDAEYKKLTTPSQITTSLLFDNLSLNSETFRHSLRVSIAILIGYSVAMFFKVGHSYFVLLTIIVILKPAFSITKKRNGDRLAGTGLGILLGILILHLTQNTTVLLILLILFMAGAYTFMRNNYFIMVLLMTPYLVLFYHLLNPVDFTLLLKDRIIDTLIGSAIAFLASIFLFPAWERERIKPAMITMLTEVQNYFTVIAEAFATKKIDKESQQFARRNALVALANLSDAFNRMLSEPKSQQKGIELIHQFVVLNHTLTSYIAALSYYLQASAVPYSPDAFIEVAENIRKYFLIAKGFLEGEEVTNTTVSKEALQYLNARANDLLEKRRQELEEGLIETSTRKSLFDLKSIVDQFILVHNCAADIKRVSQSIKLN